MEIINEPTFDVKDITNATTTCGCCQDACDCTGNCNVARPLM